MNKQMITSQSPTKIAMLFLIQKGIASLQASSGSWPAKWLFFVLLNDRIFALLMVASSDTDARCCVLG